MGEDLSEEYGLELVHARVGEEESGVIQRHHRRRPHELVLLLLGEEFYEGVANLTRRPLLLCSCGLCRRGICRRRRHAHCACLHYPLPAEEVRCRHDITRVRAAAASQRWRHSTSQAPETPLGHLSDGYGQREHEGFGRPPQTPRRHHLPESKRQPGGRTLAKLCCACFRAGGACDTSAVWNSAIFRSQRKEYNAKWRCSPPSERRSEAT
jgi:hypothetical protein